MSLQWCFYVIDLGSYEAERALTVTRTQINNGWKARKQSEKENNRGLLMGDGFLPIHMVSEFSIMLMVVLNSRLWRADSCFMRGVVLKRTAW